MAAKKKPKAWNPAPRIRAFLAAYRATCSIVKSAEAAGITRWAHYRKLESSPEYKAAFAQAVEEAAQVLEDEATRRAVDGTERMVLYHGDPVVVPVNPLKPRGKKRVLVRTEYSDQLLLALLKAKRPKEYRDRVEHELGPDTAKKFDGTLEEALALYRALVMKGDDK